MPDADYKRWQTALSVWATAATTGVRTGEARNMVWVWENEARGFMGPVDAFGILSGPHASRAVGRDYARSPLVESAPGVFTRVPAPVAKRVLTYQARIVSRNQTADSKAGRLLELARMTLHLPEIRAAWSAQDMSIAGVGDIKLFDSVGDNDRAESIAAFEFTINATPRDIALVAGADEGWIETLEMTSALVDPNGDTIPAPPNMDHEIL